MRSIGGIKLPDENDVINAIKKARELHKYHLPEFYGKETADIWEEDIKESIFENNVRLQRKWDRYWVRVYDNVLKDLLMQEKGG